MRHEFPQGSRPQRVGCVAAAAGRSNVVSLVHDQEVVSTWVARLTGRGECFPEAPKRSLPLQVVHRGDQPRKVRPRVDVYAAAAAKIANEVAVDDQELKPE